MSARPLLLSAWKTVLIVWCHFFAWARADVPYLVKDINGIADVAVNASGGICELGSTAFFPGVDRSTGEELWKTDGTKMGTARVKDIRPGYLNSDPENLTPFKGELFFTANDGISGIELWKSDGTEVGTVLVKDIRAGNSGSAPRMLRAIGNTLFFVAGDGTDGGELWKSDGTEAGTVRVKDIRAGSIGSSPNFLTDVGGVLFFSAHDGVGGVELWKSDGTEAGTMRVKDIRTGSASSNPLWLLAVGETLFFVAADTTGGVELWKSDGTDSGTLRVKDIVPGSGSSSPSQLTKVGSTLFFSANDGMSGFELWKSDGTVGGTVLVKDIESGSFDSFPDFLTEVGDFLYFSAYDITCGRELWKSDGTATGTVRVKDIIPGTGTSHYDELTEMGGVLYFRTFIDFGGQYNRALWRSDGTDAGTYRITDFEVSTLVAIGNSLYFGRMNGDGSYDLWKSDGTSEGTNPAEKGVASSRSARPGPFLNLGGIVFFAADDGIHGTELWKSDGTEAGTSFVKDISPGPLGSYPRDFAELGGVLYFVASDGTRGFELWRSDGTESGTTLVKDIKEIVGSDIAGFVRMGGNLYFIADDGVTGMEFWRTDGTNAGTVRVKDIYAGSAGSDPNSFTVVGGTMYFGAASSSGGNELWKSDGTSAGTVRVKDIYPGIIGSDPRPLGVVGNTLFFSASNNSGGREFWKTDGTDSGTIRIKDIWPGTGDSDPSMMVVVNETLFFSADDGIHGEELWKSDGTEAGTVLVRDIWVGEGTSSPWRATKLGDHLYFTASDDSTGEELWRSDGTEEGTVRVMDIQPGSRSSTPQYLVSHDGALYFSAHDDVNGRELWKSNGSEAGTVRVSDIFPGSGDSAPVYLKSVGAYLFFTQASVEHGSELWVLPPPALRFTLTGNGVEIANGDPTPRSADHTDFASVSVASGSIARTFTITNTGTDSLNLTGIPRVSVTGSDAFSVSTQPSSTIPTGSSMTFTITFNPEVDGIHEGMVSFENNDPDENPFSFAIRGYGLSANADLSGVSADTGDLAPAFSPDITDYTIAVSNSSQSIIFVPVRAQGDALLEMRSNGGNWAAVASGAATNSLALNIGANTIQIRVTAEDGNQKLYTIVVNRDKGSQSISFPEIDDQLATTALTLSATGGGSNNPVTYSVTGAAILNGNELSFSSSGEVTVTARQAGNEFYHSANPVSRTFDVLKDSAIVSLNDLVHSYDGAPKLAGATTEPNGLVVEIDYGGDAPVNAGLYPVSAAINDPRYMGSTSATLAIAKATQTILFEAIGNQVATDSVTLSAIGGGSNNPVVFGVTSGPASISNGNRLSFTGAGDVIITANQAGNSNFEAAPPVSRSFRVVTAAVSLSRLHQVADGTVRQVVVTTNPPNLDTRTTYNGDAAAPILPGSYAVQTATTDPQYDGSAAATLVVDDPARAVTVPGGLLPPLSALGELSVPTFRIGAYEVTGRLWATVVAWAEAEAGYDFDGAGSAASGDHPVTGVSWFDAAKWCNARTEWENFVFGRALAPAYQVGGSTYKTGAPPAPEDLVCDFNVGGYRLPTAAEWEYAARGGNGGAPSTYPGGDLLEDLGWYAGNSLGAPKPAGGKNANTLSLYDLAGNAAEWTWDAPAGDPGQRLLRGGAWSSASTACEITALTGEAPALRLDRSGFRVANSVALSLAAALDHPDLLWDSGGNTPWSAQTGITHDELDAGESGELIQGQSSWVETRVEGPGNLRFQWKIAGTPELDQVIFTVDGNATFVRNGVGDWESRDLEIGEGSHVLRWTFGRGSPNGEARAWLDSVEYDPATTPTVITHAALAVTNASATLGGEVPEDGRRAVTERGVVYRSAPSPALENGIVLAAVAAGPGSFNVAATGLDEGTTYFARAYATNNLGTSYGDETVFTTDTTVAFESGMKTYDRVMLSGDRHRYAFSLEGPRFVSFGSAGGAALRARIYDGEGNLLASSDGDGDFVIEELLYAGDYQLEVLRESDGGGGQEYTLTLDASTVAATRPDVAVGASATALLGAEVYAPVSQASVLISTKANAVTGHASFANRGNLPDVLVGSATGGSAFFAVTYLGPEGNITAGLLTGTYETPEMTDESSEVSIRATITPNKKKLTKKKGKKPFILKKTQVLSLRLKSTFDPAIEDAATISVQTR